jgi:hypothetical protein
VNAFNSEHRGERVPWRVNREPLMRESGTLQERLKLTAVEAPGIHRLTHGVREYEVMISPARFGLWVFGILTYLMRL